MTSSSPRTLSFHSFYFSSWERWLMNEKLPLFLLFRDGAQAVYSNFTLRRKSRRRCCPVLYLLFISVLSARPRFIPDSGGTSPLKSIHGVIVVQIPGNELLDSSETIQLTFVPPCHTPISNSTHSQVYLKSTPWRANMRRLSLLSDPIPSFCPRIDKV